jgi:hypothetical protein
MGTGCAQTIMILRKTEGKFLRKAAGLRDRIELAGEMSFSTHKISPASKAARTPSRRDTAN